MAPRIMRAAHARFLRPRAIAPPPSRPPLAKAGTVEHGGVATVDRKVPRSLEDRARRQSIEAADRMAEMRGIGGPDVLRQMRKIDILVDEMQQMPRALPGAKGTERHAGLLLKQMQEPRRRQPHSSGAVSRGHLAAGEIVEFCGRLLDAAIDVAVGQNLAKEQPVELSRGKAAAALLPTQSFVGIANPLRDFGRVSPANSCA